MVSFQCEQCGDVVTRKKLENHLRRCRNAPLTCLDCMTTFYGNDHKTHLSCISEAQKYEGSLYRGDKKSKNKNSRSNPPSEPVTPGYWPPTVEDVAANGTPQDWAVARVEVPPPAPSPPPAAPVNVFDFLVEDKSRATSVSSRSSPAPTSPKRIQKQPASPKKRVQLQEDAITYGNGPVERSTTKYASDVSLAMDADMQTPHHPSTSSTHRTPAPKAVPDPRDNSTDKKATKSGSEKKRKRPPVEELDLSESRKSSQELEEDGAPVLHSGLTGGLAKLLGRQESQLEASPLSPKKKQKHAKHETDSADGDRERHRRKKHDKADDDGTARHRRHKRHRSDGDEVNSKTIKALDAPAEVKAIEYHKPAPVDAATHASRLAWKSHSEFFLSLIDKGHGSHKGQSIYGTLKSFHDGMCAVDERVEYDTGGDRAREEKRLMKALRMKVNKAGEIVLFARPDFELGEDGAGAIKRIAAA